MQLYSVADGLACRNGVSIPCVGFGTWLAEEGAMAVNAVKKALELGFRHIDTASYYGNEKSVGQAIRESGIPRDELFVTTKLWNSDHGYHAAKLAFERS